MRFDVMTIFPKMVEDFLSESIIGRARSAGLISINVFDIRDFSKDTHKSVDDAPYGGGGGMVMSYQPIYDCYMHIRSFLSHKPHCIYLSPKGETFTQQKAVKLMDYPELCLLCGHYEGVDQRVIDSVTDEEISLGDFVLTGGELPAIALIDAVSRMVPGVLSHEDAYTDESHFKGLLEYPHYTRPVEIAGQSVPEVLLSGHHANIEKWRRQEALRITFLRRADMLSKVCLTDEDRAFLDKLKENTENHIDD